MNYDIFWLAFIAIVVAFIYLLPFFIAEHRKHNNTTSILLANLFLGWTFLGWVICIVWAFSDNIKQIKN